jgi:flagellar hook protein FlgE
MFNESGEAFSLQEGQGVEISFDGGTTTYNYLYTADTANVSTGAGGDKTFHTMADLRDALDNEASAAAGTDVNVTVSEQGKFAIVNQDAAGNDLNISVSAYTDADTTENTRFTRNMEAMNAVLPAGSDGTAFSQGFNAATHSSSIDIFDSLGSKHTLRTEFRKTALDTTTGSTWDMKISVPEPGTIDTVAPLNEKRGSIRFNNDGSLATYDPPNISFTGNNGSSPDQQVALSLGTANDFDGMTSFDSRSATSGISQDGFTGGDLVGIRVDQSGTLIGSFSNGRSFGLAQIGMAKFTNNEGLSTEGGNVYNQTANSGDPIIGTAATAGRGFIQASSSLEASNVDLSKSLTNLIIIQRGYEANGKTITTSDEMLQTLLGLKR